MESFDSRGLLLKLEATENTDAGPTAAANAFRVMNGRSGLQGEKLPRPIDRPHFGAKPGRRIKVKGFIEGDVEIVGAATPGAASPLSPLLQIAGMAETLVVGPPAIARYNVISRDIPSATGWFYHGGTLKKLTGARANLSGLMLEIGKFFTAKARIEGNCTTVTEAALPADFDFDDFQSVDPYTTETGELEINGVAVDGVSLSVDFGNALAVTEHTRARRSRITGREGSFTARFYRPALGALNVWQLWESGAEFPIVGTHGIGAGVGRGAKLLLRAQIDGVEEVELEKDYGVEIKGSLIPSNAGNDEIKLEFGTLT